MSFKPDKAKIPSTSLHNRLPTKIALKPEESTKRTLFKSMIILLYPSVFANTNSDFKIGAFAEINLSSKISYTMTFSCLSTLLISSL